MADVRLRWADESDARGVASVHVDSWRAAYAGLLPEEMLAALSVEQRTEGWSRWIAASSQGEPTDPDAEGPHRLLVAERSDRIVGWATFGPGRDAGDGLRGELGGLYAHPDHWSVGVGSSLIHRVEDELRAEGYAEAYVWVLSGNLRAIDFYERRGWASDGATKIGDEGGARDLLELRHTRVLA